MLRFNLPNSLLVVAILVAARPPESFGQSDSGWSSRLSLEYGHELNRGLSFDTSVSFFRNDGSWTLNIFDPSLEPGSGLYDNGYVNPGTLGDGTTEDWGADFESPFASLDLKAGTVTMAQTSNTLVERDYTFSNVSSGSISQDQDYSVPRLRYELMHTDGKFSWGPFIDVGYGHIDADSGPYRTFDVSGGDILHFTRTWDTFQVASGLGEIPDWAYYGEPGIDGPTIFLKPISSWTEEFDDYFSGTGTATARQSVDIHLTELRLGVGAEYEIYRHMNTSLHLGGRVSGSLTIAHGSYDFSETLQIDTHGIKRELSHHESDSSTEVLFGASLELALRGRTYIGNTPVSGYIGGRVSAREDYNIGGATLDGESYGVFGGISIEF